MVKLRCIKYWLSLSMELLPCQVKRSTFCASCKPLWCQIDGSVANWLGRLACNGRYPQVGRCKPRPALPGWKTICQFRTTVVRWTIICFKRSSIGKPKVTLQICPISPIIFSCTKFGFVPCCELGICLGNHNCWGLFCLVFSICIMQHRIETPT